MQSKTSHAARRLFLRPPKRFFFGSSSNTPPTPQSSTIYPRKELLIAANKIFSDNPHWACNKYGEALKLDENCFASLVGRAAAYCKIEVFDAALEDAERALQINPLSADSHYVKALVYIKQEEFTLALDSLHKALDLTYPIDARFESMNSIVKNIQKKMRGENIPDVLSTQKAAPIPIKPAPTAAVAAPAENPTPAAAEEDDGLPPFQDQSFLQTQQEISQKMYNMGDDKFKKRMEELATIPELQEFQVKVLSGAKPTQHDYYKLYNEPSGRFAKFAQRLALMQQHPDLQEFAQLAQTGDWNIAFSSLNNNPKAMEAYMHFFQEESKEADDDVIEAKSE